MRGDLFHTEGAALAVTLLLSLALVSPAGRAEASCARVGSELDALRSASVLFVGVARANRHSGGFTRFRVEEVWNGPDLAPAVWVQGGQYQGPWPFSHFLGVIGSNDVRFDRGKRYLVATNPNSFTTSICATNRPFYPPMRALAPPSVRPPVTGGLTGVVPPPSNALLDTVALGAVVGGLVIRRRSKRRARQSRSS